tara:strand:+ start:269 stop:475 length:207 start_codon:yes stop_codon:yes gene_type:complete
MPDKRADVFKWRVSADRNGRFARCIEIEKILAGCYIATDYGVASMFERTFHSTVAQAWLPDWKRPIPA